jgi:hypothetical protein
VFPNGFVHSTEKSSADPPTGEIKEKMQTRSQNGYEEKTDHLPKRNLFIHETAPQ